MKRIAIRSRPSLVIGVLAGAGIASSITQTMVTPLIAQLPAIFNTSASNTAWVITATLLAAAVSIPVAGRLGDMVGKRRMILVLSIPLIVGGIICAVAPTVEVMIAGRALQGLGSGMIPLGIAILRDLVPRDRLSSAIATVSATLGVGGAVGLPLSAAIIQFADWRVLFVAGSVVTAIVALAIAIFIPVVAPATQRARFDGWGAVGLTLGLIALILAVSQGATWGWGSVLTISLFAGAAVVLAVWGWWELRTADPLVDLRTTARPRVLLTNIASIFVGFAMYASFLVMPQILQLSTSTGYGLGQSVLAAGLWLAPAGLMMLILSPVGGRLSDARGPKFTLVLGISIVAVGYILGLAGMGSTWGILLTGLVVNSGIAFAYGAMPAIIMDAVPRSETAAANSFNALMRSLGTTTGAAVVGVVLAQLTMPSGGVLVPSLDGFRIALVLGAGVAIIAAIIAACIPAPRRVDIEAEAEAELVGASA